MNKKQKLILWVYLILSGISILGIFALYIASFENLDLKQLINSPTEIIRILKLLDDLEIFCYLFDSLLSCLFLINIYLFPDRNYTAESYNNTYMMAKGESLDSDTNSSTDNSANTVKGGDNIASSSTVTNTVEKDKQGNSEQSDSSLSYGVKDVEKSENSEQDIKKSESESEAEAVPIDKGKGKAKLDSIEEPWKAEPKFKGFDPSDSDSDDIDLKKEQLEADIALAKKLQEQDWKREPNIDEAHERIKREMGEKSSDDRPKEPVDPVKQLEYDAKLAELLQVKQDKFYYFTKDDQEYEKELMREQEQKEQEQEQEQEQQKNSTETYSENIETNTINSDDDEETVQKKLELQELNNRLLQEKKDQEMAAELQHQEDRMEWEWEEEKERARKRQKGEPIERPLRIGPGNRRT